jgi:Matrixin
MRVLCITLVLLILFAPGCCFPAVRTSLFGPDFTHKTLLIDLNHIGPSEYAGILSAAHEWESRTGLVSFSIVPYIDTIPSVVDPVVITNIRIDNPIVLNEEDYLRKQGNVMTEKLLGLYVDDAKPVPTIYLMAQRLMSSDSYRSVVEHELGHVLGLHHINLPGALMNESFDFQSHNITVDDLVEFCRVKYCSAIALSQRT